MGNYITTICNTNMNPEVSQYKNYWKWRHTTFLCYVYRAKYIKHNSPHKVEHYWHFTWCYKANFKINPLRLETKQEKLCLYSFKYINYKGNHQVDFNTYSFWKHCFNKEWYAKKYQELCENRNKSICSTIGKMCS